MGFWFVLLAIFVLCGGGAWLVERVSGALRTRHERKVALLRVEEQRLKEIAEAQRPAQTPQPVCGCTHHLAMHDEQGHCHEIVEVPTGWDSDRKPLGYEPGTCRCQQYVGPQPLSHIWAEELTDKERHPEGGRGTEGGGGAKGG